MPDIPPIIPIKIRSIKKLPLKDMFPPKREKSRYVIKVAKTPKIAPLIKPNFPRIKNEHASNIEIILINWFTALITPFPSKANFTTKAKIKTLKSVIITAHKTPFNTPEKNPFSLIKNPTYYLIKSMRGIKILFYFFIFFYSASVFSSATGASAGASTTSIFSSCFFAGAFLVVFFAVGCGFSCAFTSSLG